MADCITLSCPSCGAKLELSEDIGQFACAHCGQEHILYQAGGIVALKPLVEGMKNIEAAVDDASLDLAINRLYFEIDELDEKKNKILHGHPEPDIQEYAQLTGYGIFSLILSVLSYPTWHLVLLTVLIFALGFLLTFAPYFIYHYRKKVWDNTIGKQIRELDRRIESKRAEMKKLKNSEG